MNAVEMFGRCRDRQAGGWGTEGDAGAPDPNAEYQIAVEIGRTLRAAGLGVTRPAEAGDSGEVLLPEPMGNGEAVAMEAMWA